MNDKFLVNFALATLVVISFAFQHGSQALYRKFNVENSNDKRVGIIIIIFLAQLLSAAIIIEIISYALKK